MPWLLQATGALWQQQPAADESSHNQQYASMHLTASQLYNSGMH